MCVSAAGDDPPPSGAAFVVRRSPLFAVRRWLTSRVAAEPTFMAPDKLSYLPPARFVIPVSALPARTFHWTSIHHLPASRREAAGHRERVDGLIGGGVNH